MLVFSVKAVQITSYMVNGTVRVWVLWLMMFRCFIMFFMFIMFLSIILSDSQISDSCSALFIAHVSFTCWGVGRCNSCKLTSKKRLGKKKNQTSFSNFTATKTCKDSQSSPSWQRAWVGVRGQRWLSLHLLALEGLSVIPKRVGGIIVSPPEQLIYVWKMVTLRTDVVWLILH